MPQIGQPLAEIMWNDWLGRLARADDEAGPGREDDARWVEKAKRRWKTIHTTFKDEESVKVADALRAQAQAAAAAAQQ